MIRPGSCHSLGNDKWDNLTSSSVFGIGVCAVLSLGVYDGKNAISSGNYSEPNVIAVTAIWYGGTFTNTYDV